MWKTRFLDNLLKFSKMELKCDLNEPTKIQSSVVVR
jgi:hypothetical protein